MSSWIPASLKRSTTTATPPPPLEDAPLDALPASEVKPLATLEAKICDKVFSSPGLLHSSDPWRMLSPTHRRSLFLRFLRYQTLNVDKAAAHIERVARWRAEERPWTLPASAMCGPRAGLPMLELGIRGMDAEILMYGLAKHYVKAEVDHAAQQEAIKVMFEQLFYVPTGSLGRSGVLIVDFNELSMRNVDLVATKNGIRIFLNYYPEMFKKIMLINYPKWIYGTWKLIEPLLDTRTVHKIEWICSASSLGTELSKYFAKEDIPRWLGGNGEDGKVKLYTGASFDVDEVARTMQC